MSKSALNRFGKKQFRMTNVPLVSLLVYPVAKNWIAGKSISEAIEYSELANSRGFSVILNYLGEEVDTAREVQEALTEYEHLLDLLQPNRIAGCISRARDENVMLEMTKDLLLSAKAIGADCIVTPCPMCHFNLDAKQKAVENRFDLKIDMPILYFTQLMGIAFGLNPKELGLGRNVVSLKKILDKLETPIQIAAKA